LEEANANLPRVEAKLSTGALHSVAEARSVADAHLAWYLDNSRRQFDVAMETDDPTQLPYTTWHPGDTLTIEDYNSDPTLFATSTQRTAQITVTENDDTGGSTVTPSFVPPSGSPGAVIFIDPDQALLNTLKKMSNGTLRGQSRAAQPYIAESLGPTPQS